MLNEGPGGLSAILDSTFNSCHSTLPFLASLRATLHAPNHLMYRSPPHCNDHRQLPSAMADQRTEELQFLALGLHFPGSAKIPFEAVECHGLAGHGTAIEVERQRQLQRRVLQERRQSIE